MNAASAIRARHLKVVLAAEESAGMQLLRGLAAEPHQIVGVLARKPANGDTGANVWQVASKLGLTTWDAKSVRDPAFAATLAGLEPDVLLNVHSLYVIRPEILATARYGGFNLHPGPLPRYAGLNAPSWAIYRSEQRHGVTLHKMDAGIDTGPIAFQTMFDIEPADTALTLSAKCVKAGLPLIYRLIEILADDPNALTLEPMAPGSIEYFGREVPQEGLLSWQAAAADILNFIRACDYYPFPSPWGHPVATFGEKTVGMVKAEASGRPASAPPGTISAREGANVEIACADETILVSHVQIDDRYVPAGEVLQPGQRLGDGRP